MKPNEEPENWHSLRGIGRGTADLRAGPAAVRSKTSIPPAVPTAWLAAFPGTRFLPKSQLMLWHPEGVLDIEQIEAVVRWIEAVEPPLGKFNRFIDFSGLTEVHLRFEDVEAAARRRRERYTGAHVTTVFLAERPLTYGFARMYEHLMWGVPIEVRVTSKLSEAAAILGVLPEVLRPEWPR